MGLNQNLIYNNETKPNITNIKIVLTIWNNPLIYRVWQLKAFCIFEDKPISKYQTYKIKWIIVLSILLTIITIKALFCLEIHLL